MALEINKSYQIIINIECLSYHTYFSSVLFYTQQTLFNPEWSNIYYFIIFKAHAAIQSSFVLKLVQVMMAVISENLQFVSFLIDKSFLKRNKMTFISCWYRRPNWKCRMQKMRAPNFEYNLIFGTLSEVRFGKVPDVRRVG